MLLGGLGELDVLFSTMVWTGIWLLVGFEVVIEMERVYTGVSPVTALDVGLSSMMRSSPLKRARGEMCVSRGNCLGS